MTSSRNSTYIDFLEEAIRFTVLVRILTVVVTAASPMLQCAQEQLLVTTSDRYVTITGMTTEHDNRVYIHAGKYKGRYGTYMGQYGKVMCSIRIDGDTALHRNLWLSSVTRIERSTGGNETDDVMITISREEMLEIVNTIADLKNKMELLEKKLESLVLNTN